MTNSIYCTYLTVYSGTKLPPLYIGSTSVQKIEEGYHGSVSSKKYRDIWIKELIENPHLFETQILTTHSTREEAFEEEVRYQIEHDVIKSAEYINMAVAKKKFIFVDYNDPEYRKKLSESAKKRFENLEFRKKMSEVHKKRYENPEERKKTSESQKGKTHSEESKKKMSESAKKRFEDPEERKKFQKIGLSYFERAANSTNAPPDIMELIRGIAKNMGSDEVLLYYLFDDYLKESDPKRKEILKVRMQEVQQKLEKSGEYQKMIENAKAQEDKRKETMPYLSPLLFEIIEQKGLDF